MIALKEHKQRDRIQAPFKPGLAPVCIRAQHDILTADCAVDQAGQSAEHAIFWL